MPDHLHCVWKLPEDDSDNEGRWRAIKAGFTARFHEMGHESPWQSESRRKRRESGFWQRRGWEHLLRTQEDLNRHVDYTHYNPVKHGLAGTPREWPWTTLHRYIREGTVPADWGRNVEPHMRDLGTTGE